MASIQIPNLPAAIGLSGTELFEGVQSGASVKITLNQIIAALGGTVPLPVSSGGTGFSTYTIGDILYASASQTFSKLADVALGNAIISGGVGAVPSYGKIGLTTHVSGVLPVANGGTNQSAALTQYGMIYGDTTTSMASTAAGTSTTLLHGNASGAPTWSAVSLTADVTGILPVANGGSGTSSSGTAYQVLHGNSTWSAVSLTTDISGTLPVANGGTNITSYAIGDLLYASTTGILSKLADVATGNALISGGVGAAPSYGKIGLTTHVSGTLPVANGGTGQASNLTQYGVVYGSTTSAMATSAAGTTTTVLHGNAAGAPTFGAVSLTADVSGTLPVANGGTNITSYAVGDLIAASASGVLSRIADIAVGNALLTGGVGVLPAYGKVTLTGHVSGVLPVANGGTNVSSYTIGDILYASTTGVLSSLADVATGNAIISGGVGAAPSYGKIGLTTHVSGTLPVANGGTNITSYAVGDILYASASGVLSPLADVATGNVLLSGGVTTAPSYGKVGLTTHVSGTLPVANGGTGQASNLTQYGVVYGSTTSAMATSAAGTTTTVLHGNAAGAPTFGAVSLTADVSGILPVLNGGTGVTTSTGTGAVVLGTNPTITGATVSSSTVDGTNPIGFKNIPPVGTKTASYTLAVADVGKYVQVGSGGAIVIPDSTFANGDAIVICNNTAGNITITCTITTAYIGGTDTDKATVTLATRGVANIFFLSGTVCVITGNVT
jgi:hypothetical protein